MCGCVCLHMFIFSLDHSLRSLNSGSLVFNWFGHSFTFWHKTHQTMHWQWSVKPPKHNFFFFFVNFDLQTLLVSCSGINPRKSEQLHSVLKQLGLAGEQVGETGVFLRYTHYHTHTYWASIKSEALWDNYCETSHIQIFWMQSSTPQRGYESVKDESAGLKIIREYRYLHILNVR